MTDENSLLLAIIRGGGTVHGDFVIFILVSVKPAIDSSILNPILNHSLLGDEQLHPAWHNHAENAINASWTLQCVAMH